MNNFANAVNTIEFAIAIGFLIWFFYGPWNLFIVDLARQNLFELRDEVFMLAADGKLEFSSDAYTLLRDRLNKMIRYSHHLTLANLVALPSTAIKAKATKDVLVVIRSIQDRELARELERTYMYAVMVMLATMFLRSFTLIVLFVLLLPVAIVTELLKGAGGSNLLVSKVRSAVERDIDLESAVSCN